MEQIGVRRINLNAIIMEQEIRGGPNVHVSRYGDQHVVSAQKPRYIFQAAFSPRWNGDTVTIGYGTVNGIVPLIDGKPIGGSLNNADTPKIKVEGYDEEGRSYVCIKVEVDEKTYKIKKGGVTIISTAQVGNRTVGEAETDANPLVGICPIAVATNTGIHQIVYFNLNHAVGKPPMGPQTPQHFFW